MEKPSITNRKRNFVHGTAVFVARTPSQVVVSADSRQVDENAEFSSDEVCKIRKFGTGYVVVNGFTSSEESDYNFFTILNEAVRENLSLAKNTARLEAAIQPILLNAVKRVQSENKDSFQRNMVGKEAMAFCAFGIDGNRPVFYKRGFQVLLSESGEVFFEPANQNCPDDNTRSSAGLFLVSNVDHVREAFFKKYTTVNGILSGSLIGRSREFIQMHIDAGVPDVGGPIDIIRVTMDGVNWVQRKDGCEE